MSQMNPKEVFDNTALHTQFNYLTLTPFKMKLNQLKCDKTYI